MSKPTESERLEAVGRIAFRLYALKELNSKLAKRHPLNAMIDQASGKEKADMRLVLEMLQEQLADKKLIGEDFSREEKAIKELEKALSK